jgi:hypothetical protein
MNKIIEELNKMSDIYLNKSTFHGELLEISKRFVSSDIWKEIPLKYRENIGEHNVKLLDTLSMNIFLDSRYDEVKKIKDDIISLGKVLEGSDSFISNILKIGEGLNEILDRINTLYTSYNIESEEIERYEKNYLFENIDFMEILSSLNEDFDNALRLNKAEAIAEAKAMSQQNEIMELAGKFQTYNVNVRKGHLLKLVDQLINQIMELYISEFSRFLKFNHYMIEMEDRRIVSRFIGKVPSFHLTNDDAAKIIHKHLGKFLDASVEDLSLILSGGFKKEPINFVGYKYEIKAFVHLIGSTLVKHGSGFNPNKFLSNYFLLNGKPINSRNYGNIGNKEQKAIFSLIIATEAYDHPIWQAFNEINSKIGLPSKKIEQFR